jgi:hypothetical protein
MSESHRAESDSHRTEAIAGDVKERHCLSCEGTFTSHWAGERVCKNCKQGSAWRAGVSYKPARTR